MSASTDSITSPARIEATQDIYMRIDIFHICKYVYMYIFYVFKIQPINVGDHNDDRHAAILKKKKFFNIRKQLSICPYTAP